MEDRSMDPDVAHKLYLKQVREYNLKTRCVTGVSISSRDKSLIVYFSDGTSQTIENVAYEK